MTTVPFRRTTLATVKCQMLVMDLFLLGNLRTWILKISLVSQSVLVKIITVKLIIIVWIIEMIMIRMMKMVMT